MITAVTVMGRTYLQVRLSKSRSMVRRMGKHTQRTPGHLPTVATGAAPGALLPTTPAPSLADPTLPLDGLPLAAVPDPLATAARELSVGPSLAAVVSDFVLCDPSNSLTAVKSANGFSPAPRLGSPAELMTADSSRMAASALDGSVREGAWLPYPAGAAAPPDSGRFTGDLHGGMGQHRPSCPTTDTGPAAVVVNSEQRGMGQFAGSLELSPADVPPNSGRRHATSTDAGPVSGLLAATQSLPANGFRGELSTDDLAPARPSTTTEAWPRPGQPRSAEVGTPLEMAPPPLV
ncbi:hypothetical protein [Amycolatopsis sp. NPDC051903]|uniref:hypothetical protein n=1 Tax=Amycolatopsis sp. NPDC051903 TaxID=3363936 RepID=UPI0037B35529